MYVMIIFPIVCAGKQREEPSNLSPVHHWSVKQPLTRLSVHPLTVGGLEPNHHDRNQAIKCHE